MKRIIYIVIFILIVLLCLKLCIRQDLPTEDVYKHDVIKDSGIVNYPKDPINVVLMGKDYLQSQAPIGKYGGELISSTIGEGPKTFNPFTSKDSTSSSMAGLMFDGLFTTDPKNGRVIPKLAKSYETKDGMTYIVKLRHGAIWSDGFPITADDVVFTWKDIILAGLGNTSIRDMVIIDGKLPQVYKVDDYTVKFVVSKPFSPFLRLLSTQIAPKHIFAPVVKQGQKAFDSFYYTNTNPSDFVTSGPFKLKEYKAAQRVVFVRNPDYYMINKQNKKLPYLDKVVYLILGDLNNEILKFEAKEIDVIGLRGSNVAPYKSKEAKSDYRIYNIGPDTGTMFLVLNLNKRKSLDTNYYVHPEKQFWFNDKNFRTAID